MKDTAILIHTHTEYLDALEICMGQLQKYFPTTKKYILVNEEIDRPEDETVSVLVYDEAHIYTKRIREALKSIPEQMILYTHEDMILYAEPDYSELSRVLGVMESFGLDFVKLIATTGITEMQHTPNLRMQLGYTFAVQPTLWKRESLSRLMSSYDVGIWELETHCQDFCMKEMHGYTYFTGKEKLRGQAHYDSFIYPYIATAIVKGKWNNLEYSSELFRLFDEYGLHSDRSFMV